MGVRHAYLNSLPPKQESRAYGKLEGIELSLEISHVSFSLFLMLVFSEVYLSSSVGLDKHSGFLHGFASGQLGLLLSLDHRRLDDRQSLGARTAAAQKKKRS